MTFNEIAKVSDACRLIPIKDKEYATVNQRVKSFRMICPNGAIETELVKFDEGICVVKATIKDESGKILSTGLSYEREGSSLINRTSFLENCETSAVGRAIGFIGIGIEQGMASADEMEIALEKQKELKYSCIDCGTEIKAIDKVDKSGQMSAQEISEYSMKYFGKCLCSDCMKKKMSSK